MKHPKAADSENQEVEDTANVGDADGLNPAAETSELQDLQAKIEVLEASVLAEKDNYLRTLAEFQNYKRRVDEQRAELAQFSNQELLKGLLPVIDNFERAVASGASSQSYESLYAGVQLTLKQLQNFLQKNGIEPIEALGKEFDPNLHEAIMRDEESDAPENSVVEEMQRGYTIHGRVLRPAMVKVALKS